MKQFFTVAVPTYNSALYIRQCLNGILSQTFRDFHLLILDDCSTDQTPEIVKPFLPEFEKKGIPAKLIQHNPNIGGYANFNRCIDLAEGKYLFIHHADDVMKPEMLETIHERISALGDFSLVHVNSNAISKTGETETCYNLLRGTAVSGRRILRTYYNVGFRSVHDLRPSKSELTASGTPVPGPSHSTLSRASNELPLFRPAFARKRIVEKRL